MNKLRLILAVVCLLCIAGSAPAELQWKKKPPRNQLLDTEPPLYEISFEYDLPASQKGVNLLQGNGDDLSIWNIEFMWAGPLYKDIIGADIDLRCYLDNIVFVTHDSADDMTRAALGITFTWRLKDGDAVVAGAAPGVYGEIEEFSHRLLYCPFSLYLVKGFDANLGGIFGVDVRPDFDFPVMPRVGVIWQSPGNLRLDACIPESKLTWDATSDWDLYLGLKWKNMSYSIKEESGSAVDQITLNEFRFLVGTSLRVTDEFSLLAEFGEVFGRKLSGRHVVDHNDIGNTAMCRIGLAGYF